MLPALASLAPGSCAPVFPRRALPLHALPVAMGWSRESSPAYSWHGLRRGRGEMALWQYTLAGEGRLRVGERIWAVGPGEAMLLHFPADNHYWLPEGGAGWEFIFVCLQGREVMRVWPAIEQGLGPCARLAPDSAAVVEGAGLVAAALREELGSPFTASAWAYRLLMALVAAARAGGPTSEHDGVARARRYGEQHFAQALRVEDLARVAGLSRYHFTRLFTAREGVPPAAWLIDLRVKHAAMLLRTTELGLKVIAARCGFPDAHYLGKVFRGRMGQTPGDYRRAVR
jgi:AraC family transcriptional regulator